MKFNLRFDENPLIRIENNKIYYGLFDDDWFMPESFLIVSKTFQERGKLFVLSEDGMCEMWHFTFDEICPYKFIRCITNGEADTTKEST